MKLDGKIISAHVIDEDYIIATITYPMRFPVSDEHDMRTVEIGIPPSVHQILGDPELQISNLLDLPATILTDLPVPHTRLQAEKVDGLGFSLARLGSKISA